jgi:RsiW-degrading membrane proteinase PrsW (M82 family)
MNAYVANHEDNPVMAVVWTLVAGLFFGLPAIVVAAMYIRRNRDNLGLCIVLGLIALIWTLLWIGVLSWQLGGSTSLHHGHPSKVP